MADPAPAPPPTAIRQSTGVDGLDNRLGGGLMPGTLTVVVGASGAGKTQFGLQYLRAGRRQEGRCGIIFDMTARIDSQNHANYAQRMFGWSLTEHPHERFSPDRFFDEQTRYGDYIHVFDAPGRRVTQREMNLDDWHDWQVELATKLELAVAFFYGNFVRGARRALIDGVEPALRPGESIQIELVEYIYHQILRKEPPWVARDLFRQSFRAHAEVITRHVYDPRKIGAMLLVTSHEMMLEKLIARPLADGDLLAVANTVVYMGKLCDGAKISRGIHIGKHRGSACSDEIIRYTIDDDGLRLE